MLNNVYKFSFYLTENTSRLYYTDHSGTSVQGKVPVCSANNKKPENKCCS